MADREKYEGKAAQMKGKVKEEAGRITGDEEMEAEGQADQAKGGVKEKLQDAKDNVKDALD